MKVLNDDVETLCLALPNDVADRIRAIIQRRTTQAHDDAITACARAVDVVYGEMRDRRRDGIATILAQLGRAILDLRSDRRVEPRRLHAVATPSLPAVKPP